ncbi:MAG: hypothetical protein RBR38_16440 [Desulfomicrobium apsheronum]|nr:hypothetical protein [Desulfomicrobium apsheronum]
MNPLLSDFVWKSKTRVFPDPACREHESNKRAGLLRVLGLKILTDLEEMIEAGAAIRSVRMKFPGTEKLWTDCCRRFFVSTYETTLAGCRL